MFTLQSFEARRLLAVGDAIGGGQFGTTTVDVASDIALDAEGNSYVSGTTYGSLAGTKVGDADAYLLKFNAAREPVWTRQFGTGGFDAGSRVAVDADGNVFVAGDTVANVPGTDGLYVRKFDAAGALLWVRSFGVTPIDTFGGLAVDADGNAFVAGSTYGDLAGPNADDLSSDAFVIKFDPAGDRLWARQYGTADYESVGGLAVDAGGDLYASGVTGGALGGTNAGGDDAYVRKFDAAGGTLWTRQFGTGAIDSGNDVAVGADGSVYVAGTTGGGLVGTNAGGDDAFVRKFDATGMEFWTRQFGTDADDTSNSVAVNAEGHVSVSGTTEGSLGAPAAGKEDAFVRTFDAAGDTVATWQLGTPRTERGTGVAVAADGGVYLVGVVSDTDTDSDDSDGFVAVSFVAIAGRKLFVAGTAGDDHITFTRAGGDVTVRRDAESIVFARAAFDRVEVQAGNGADRVDLGALDAPAYLSGGSGDDTLVGGNARDTLTGGAGRNRLYGGEGNDRLNGSAGRDFLYGEAGDDRLYGNDGNDQLDGGGGKDRAWAGAGDDSLIGGSSVDRLYGEAGNDSFVGGPGNDYLFGGEGADVNRSFDAGDVVDSVEAIG